MNQHVVITATGPDQVGIVDKITEVLLEFEANVEESRMARLGGEFTAVILISIPEKNVKELSRGLEKLKKIQLSFSWKTTQLTDTKKFEGYVPYEVTVIGADQEGIVNRIAHYFSENRINIETLETTITNAPTTGTPLFSMHAVAQVPAKISLSSLRKNLTQIGNEMGTDVEVKLLVK